MFTTSKLLAAINSGGRTVRRQLQTLVAEVRRVRATRRARYHGVAALHHAVGQLFEQLETRRLMSLTADFGGNQTVAEGSTININGLTSTADSPATIVAYRWDLNYNAMVGFHTTVTGPGFNFKGGDGPSTRNIALRVTDSNGLTATTTGTITITNVAPTLTLNLPAGATEGVDYSISWSRTDPGTTDTISGWAVDWGDGNSDTFAANVTAGTHRYDADGSYTVTLTATDEDGSYTASSVLAVANNPPIVNVTPTSQNANEGQTINVGFTSPNREDSIELWTIDWGDGKTDVYFPGEDTGSHAYDDNGHYSIVVTAIEPDSGGGGAVATVNVANVDPDVTITGTPGGNVNEGAAISLDANPTDAGVVDTFNYAWTVTRNGNAYDLTGVTSNAATLLFNPTDDGTYVATVVVTDDDGGSATAHTTDITVVNVAPNVSVNRTPAGNQAEGTAITVTASATDVTGDTLSYAWSVTKGGNAYTLPDGTDTHSAALVFTPNDNGSYIATVVVSDEDGGHTTVASAAITITNAAPVATINNLNGAAHEGDTLGFSSTVTDAGTTDTFSYAWSLTKGGVAVDLTGVTTDHAGFSFVPDDNEAYVVSLTVTDKDGGTSTDTDSFNVANVAPVAHAGSATGTLTEAQTISFLATSDEVGSADTVSYSWAVDKNSSPYDLTGVTTNTAAFAFVPDDNGSYAVTVTATDDDGDSTTSTTTITIGNANPTPTITDGTVPTDEGSAAAFTATATDASSVDDTAGYTFNWTATLAGNSIAMHTGSSFNFTPQDDGAVVVTLQAVDKDGGSSTTTRSFSVANVNPGGTISGEPVGHIDEGSTVSLTANPTDAGSADTFTYAWSVTKGGIAYDLTGVTTNAAALNFVPNDNETYVATVVISDDNGGTHSVSTGNIVVDNVAPIAAVNGAPAHVVSHPSATIDATQMASVDDSGNLDSNAFWMDAGEGGSNSLHIAVMKWQLPGGLSANDVTDATLSVNVASIGGFPERGIDLVAFDSSSSTVVGSDYADADGASTTLETGVIFNTGTHTVSGTGLANAIKSAINAGRSYLSLAFRLSSNVAQGSPAIVFFSRPADAASSLSIEVTQPGTVAEGSTTTLSAGVTDPGSVDTQTYAWSVTKGGNPYDLTGVTTNAATFDFVPDDQGVYVVSLTVTDKDGGTDTVTSNINATNVAPVGAITGAGSSGMEGAAISVGTTAHDQGPIDTLTYAWSVTKDNVSYDLTGVTTNASTFAFTPNDNGNYVISLAVTDKDGATSTFTTGTIAVGNENPTGTITGAPANSNEGTAISLGSTATDLGTADTITKTWFLTAGTHGLTTQFYNTVNLTGGVVLTRTDATIDYNWSGTNPGVGVNSSNFSLHSAGLLVAPASGMYEIRTSSDDGIRVSIAGQQVINNWTVHGTQTNTASVYLQAGKYYPIAMDYFQGGGGAVLQLAWTKPDNTTETIPTSALYTTVATGTGNTIAYTPTDNGTLVAQLVVTDDDNGYSLTTPATITVDNVAPTPTITDVAVPTNEGDAAHFTASATDPSSVDTTAGATFDWIATLNGDTVASSTGSDFTFTTTDNGAYVVTLTATDKDGGHASTTRSFTVANVAPTATIGGIPGGISYEGDTLALTATPHDAGSADTTFTYSWSGTRDTNPIDLSGLTTNQASFSYSIPNQGDYVFTVRVTDKDGDFVDQATGTLSAFNSTPTSTGVTGPSTGSEAVALTGYAANGHDAGVEDTLSYVWSVTKNTNPYNVGGVPTTNSTFGFTPDDNGTYVVSVVITDNDGASDTFTKTTTVANLAPTGVAITGAPALAPEGGTILVGSTASDVAADTVTRLWSVTKDGNAYDLTGVTTNGSTFSFIPNDNGDFIITLTASDEDGGSTTVSTSTISVTNALPFANVTGTPGAPVNEGTPITLGTGAADPGSADVLSFAWTVTKGGGAYTLPGGTDTSSRNFTFTPRDNGTYVAYLHVTDDDGGFADAHSGSITVNNVAPTPSITGNPGSANEGDTISLGSNPGDPGSDDTFTYAWSVTRNSNPYALSGSTTGSSLGFVANDQGTYVATLVVTDDDGGTNSTTATINVANVAPTAVLTNVPGGNVNEGSAVTLGATVTEPGVNDVVSYAWTAVVGGNTVASGTASTFSFTPTDQGNYTVSLTTSDADGGSSTTTASVAVVNVAPTPTITGSTTGSEGVSVSLTGAATDPSSDDTTSGFTFAWTVTRGGQSFATGTGSNIAFMPTDNGDYVVTLTATDKDGGHSDATSTVAVANTIPTATINGLPGSSVNEGTSVTLTPTVGDASSEDVTAGFTYAWTILQGSTTIAAGSSAAGITFTLPDNGTYTARLVVTDKDGGSRTTTGLITATNVAPSSLAISGAPSSAINEGDSVSLTASATDVAGDAVTYAWSVTRDSDSALLATGAGTSFSYTTTDSGSLTIAVTATDKDHAQTSTSVSVAVNNVNPAATITGLPSGSVNEGATVSLGTSVTDVSSADTTAGFTYAWTISKGSSTVATGTSATLDFVVPDNGTYDVSVVATDKDGGSNTATGTITAVNVVPSPTISGTTTGIVEGGTVSLTGSATDPGSADTTGGFTFAWAVTRGGNSFATGAGSSFNFTPTDNGDYVVTLTATDKDGEHSATSTTVSVANAAPTVSINGLTGPFVEGDSVTLTSTVGDAGSEDVTAGFTYAWIVTSGSSTIASGTSSAGITFVIPDNGTYGVSLTVSDKDGTPQTATGSLTATNALPSAVAISGAPVSPISEGDAVNLTASAHDVAGDALTYAWAVTLTGDSTVLASGTGGTFAINAPDNGQYTITLTATDKDGGASHTSVDITVNNVSPVAGITGLPSGNVSEGATVSLGSGVTDAGSADTTAGFTYAWTITKGSSTVATGTSSTLDFVVPDNGTYVVSLTVTDKDGGTDTDAGTITAINVAPTPSITGTTTGIVEGGTVSLTGSATDPSSADTTGGLTLAWAVTRGGNSFATGTGSSFNFTPTDNGDYVVTLTATDKDGDHSASTTTVSVANANPTATLNGLPGSTVNEGASVTLTSTVGDAGSEDVAGLTYAWTILKGSSTVASGTSSAGITFTIPDNGTYTARLVVTDKDGGSVTTTGLITATNVAPSGLAISGAPSGAINEGDSLSLTASATDVSGDNLTYSWSMTRDSDGAIVASTAGSSFHPTTNDNGDYTVTVTAVDKDHASTSTSISVTVNNVNPVATLGGMPSGSVNEGATVSLSASGSDVSSVDTTAGFTYAWTISKGGSTVATGANATIDFVVPDEGSYNVSLTVTDKDGGSDTKTGTFAAIGVSPTPTINGDTSSVKEGDTLSLTASATDPSSADTTAGFTYAWVVSKDDQPFGSGTGAEFSFHPTDNGAYVITLTATDKDGAHRLTTRSVTVSNKAPVATINGLPSGSVGEGAETSLTASVADASLDTTAGFTYGWSVTKGNTVVAYGNTANLTFVAPDQGTYTVNVTVTDKDGASDTKTGTITATNVAPSALAITGAPGSAITEGANISVTASANDVDNDTVSYAWSVTKAGSNGAVQTGSGSAFTFHAVDNGTYTLSVTASDEDGGSSSTTATITVNNANPTMTLTAPNFSPVRGQTFSFGLSANDVPADAALTYSVNWGDGTAATAFAPVTSTISKSFAEARTYAVSVTVMDKDGGTVTQTQNIDVKIAALQANPLDPNTTAIMVGGTSGDDGVRIEAGTTAGSYKVRMNGSIVGTFSPTGNVVVVNGYAGNDNIALFKVAPKAIFLGGDGDDALVGSSNTDLLVGGNGNDMLSATDARDILLGGAGRDSLDGGTGDDLLLAGSFSGEGSLATLASVYLEWNSGNDVATRIAHLAGTTGGGANGSTILSHSTVFSDAPVDQITGGNGKDWFMLAPASDVTLDFKKKDDTLTDIT